MSRPVHKDDLMLESEKTYHELMQFIDTLPESVKTQAFPPGTLNRDIRDVLGHLHQWHHMMLDWYQQGMKGLKPVMPAEGYSWKDTPKLNATIQQRYHSMPLKDVRKLFMATHKKVHGLIIKHNQEELFVKKYYPWTGSTSLGAYLISATSSHYSWALKLIKKSLAIK